MPLGVAPPLTPDPSHQATVLPNSARVVKKILPSQRGAQRWVQHYGQQLVCVRYRDDLHQGRRVVTVELQVDARPLCALPEEDDVPPVAMPPAEVCAPAPAPQPGAPQPDAPLSPPEPSGPISRHHVAPVWPQQRVAVRIGRNESALLQRARQAGARWEPDLSMWKMSRAQAEACGLTARIFEPE